MKFSFTVLSRKSVTRFSGVGALAPTWKLAFSGALAPEGRSHSRNKSPTHHTGNSPANPLPSPGDAPPFRESRFGWLVLAAVWLASALYLAACLRRGWIPFDAGMLAESASRVLRGQLPHRDFGGLYTGGLAFLNALSFRLFGASFLSPRIFLYLFFLGWVPAVYRIARRFAAPLAAALVTLLAVAWSVPAYPEAMPSWYNLFFATWGIAALIRYIETDRPPWLFLAGLCAGFSFLAKISGLYFLAAVLLFLIFREHSLSRSAHPAPRKSARLYPLFVTAGLLLFLAALALLVAQRPSAAEFTHFVFPSACLAALLLWQTWTEPSPPNAARFRRFFSMAALFLAGALLPVALFLLWFAGHHALHAWFLGVFVRPALRTHWAARDAVPLTTLAGLVPALLVALFAYDRKLLLRSRARWLVPLALAALLLLASKSVTIYSFIGFSLPLLVPLLALAALLLLPRPAGLGEPKRQQLFLLLAAAITWGLIQFPFSAVLYFSYVAPLVILALAALCAVRPPRERTGLAALAAFYLLFALWLHPPAYYQGIGVPSRQSVRMQTLAPARAGGIRAPAPLARETGKLIRLVRAHARGRYIFATPAIPDVYFLSGYRNPTPTIADLLDPDFFSPAARNQRILDTIETHHVNVVVIGPGDPTLSGPVDPALRSLLDAQFPRSEFAGNFEVRWKPRNLR